MTKEEYSKIRNRKTFLYDYFIANGGFAIPYPQFSLFLGVWLSRSGHNSDNGFRKIVEFLDKKFDYK